MNMGTLVPSFDLKKHLLDLVLARVERNLGLEKDIALAGHRVQPVDRRRQNERLETK
jgi:hypothetical protein